VKRRDGNQDRNSKRYLARGWSILPLRARDKRPLLGWEPLQSSRPSADQVSDWFKHWPDANIEIVSGEISNLIVLDIDPAHGGDASLDRLERELGQLPVTPGGLIRNRTGLAQG
jgi:hypothetical protein